MHDFNDITEWVQNEIGITDSIGDDTSLQALGVYGDDWDELLDAYSVRFGVDMVGYLWYFHTKEEGSPGIGGLFVPPPNERVPQIAVTVGMLRAFATSGRWDIEYPPHELPAKRYDILINKIFVGAVVAGSVGILMWKHLG